MKQPQTSYRIAEISLGNCVFEYHIVNEDNETIEVFREYDDARSSLQQWLPEDELAEWEEHWSWLEYKQEQRQAERSEQMFFYS